MKLTLMITCAILTAGSSAFGYGASGLSEETARLNGIFEGRGSTEVRDILVKLKTDYSASPEVTVPVDDPVSDGSHFISLNFSTYNPWTKTGVHLELNAAGALMLLGPNKNRQYLTLSPEEIAHVQGLWSAAHLEPGNKSVGKEAMDATTFKLYYSLCGSSFNICKEGSVSGALIPSIWTTETTDLKSLIQYLQRLPDRFKTGPVILPVNN